MKPTEYEQAVNRRTEAAQKLTAIRRRLHKAAESLAAEEELRIATEEVERVGNRQFRPRKKTGAKQG